MKPFVLLSVPLLGVLGLSSVGCGGLPAGGVQAIYEVSPERVFVAPGGTVTLTASIAEASYTSVEFSVVEGDAGGAVTPAVHETGTEPYTTYTAPAKVGTYHVRLRVLDGTKVAATRTATIGVRIGG